MPEPRLTLVGTPIGSVDELSARARAVLADAGAIACEDTRKLRWLLREVGIDAPPSVIVANEHTEEQAAERIVGMLREGRSVAMVSDAGMPGIADPGTRVVRAVLDAGFEVTVANGPSAMVAALVVSGLPTGRFVFEGFLPRSGSGRRERLDALASEPRTIGLFEAPHRVARLLDELLVRCGPDRPVALCRELTKIHEDVWRGMLAGAVESLAGIEPRGEFAVVLGGAPPPAEATDDDLRTAVAHLVADGLSRRDAIDAVSSRYGVARNRVYQLARA
jgi:16S rRNA (cytidine1402-2'-O)-methyltransferase